MSRFLLSLYLIFYVDRDYDTVIPCNPMEVLPMGFLDQPEKSQTIPLVKLRVGHLYVYSPNGWDTFHPTSNNTLHPGQVVRVINLLGASRDNTQEQCYVADRETGKFICMVSTAS